ncbi:MAG: LysE family translocator [Paracoccaceae bacterium]
MGLSDWFLLAMVCLAGAASPGPSVILLINSVIKDGRKAGVAFGIAHGLGIFVYSALVASGLIILLSLAPWFSVALEFTGFLFLLWLSISMIKNSFQKVPMDETGSDPSSVPLFEYFRNGFLIVFLNPKIAAFYLAIFSQFLDTASNLEHKFLMVATATVIDGLWYILLTFVIAVPKFIKFFKLSAKKIEFFLGVVLLLVSFVLGINIAFTVF